MTQGEALTDLAEHFKEAYRLLVLEDAQVKELAL